MSMQHTTATTTTTTAVAASLAVAVVVIVIVVPPVACTVCKIFAFELYGDLETVSWGQ